MRPSDHPGPATSVRRRRRAAGLHATPGRTPSTLATGPAIALAALLAGCASTPAASRPGGPTAPVATRWHAPLPHGGQLTDLSRWWAQLDDPLLLSLIESGQRVSPTVAEASARIAEARAGRAASRAALLPSLDATADGTRAKQAFGGAGLFSTASMASVGVQATWELDLFGAGRAGADAAHARLEATQAGWHDARVSVAAEVATTYVELRACEAQAQQAGLDATSRARTSRLSSQAAMAGIQARAVADQANASAAQGAATLLQQRMRCDLLVKVLTALTAQDEEALRRELVIGAGRLPEPAGLRVASLPAEALAQRPDLHAAAREVVAASADAAQARARRWPRVSLAGSIGLTRVGFEGQSAQGSVWSVGPVTVTLPLFDGGARRANVEAARARYDAATSVYAARLREAIREVESALVTLDGTARRSDVALVAADGFDRSFQATEASYQAGVASLFELEDARRNLVAARSAVIDLQRERVSAWIALYRALGGGWSSPAANEGAAAAHE